MPDIVPNVSHTVVSQQAAIDGGRMDGYACIGGYTPDQAPNLAALARRFAISDRTFSMADSPSWGGHLYAVMGSLGFSITADNDWLGQVASAVMNGPEWPSTVLFITWDDCGCFYDQVPPGVNRTERRRDRARPWSSSARTPSRAIPTPPRRHSPESSPVPSTLRACSARRERQAGVPVQQCVQLSSGTAPARAYDLPPVAA